MRGKRRTAVVGSGQHGITPAYAGKTKTRKEIEKND